MTFAQRRSRLTTHFSERIPVVKRRISVFAPALNMWCVVFFYFLCWKLFWWARDFTREHLRL